jgi:hypothetical protein
LLCDTYLSQNFFATNIPSSLRNLEHTIRYSANGPGNGKTRLSSITTKLAPPQSARHKLAYPYKQTSTRRNGVRIEPWFIKLEEWLDALLEFARLHLEYCAHRLQEHLKSNEILV